MCNNELRVQVAYSDNEGRQWIDPVRYSYSRAIVFLSDLKKMFDLPPYQSVQYDVVDFTESISMGVFRFLDEEGEIIPDYCFFTDVFKNHNI